MKISNLKKEKISEQILQILYSNNLKPLFTSHIAKEIARDEEFTKSLLLELKIKKIVTEVKKNSKGVSYIKRSRWVLSDLAKKFYRNRE